MNLITKNEHYANGACSVTSNKTGLFNRRSAGQFPNNRLAYKHIVRIMKLTFILMTVTLMNVYSNGYSQKVTLSGKRVPLENFFSTIKEQTGYVFFYNEALLKTANPVTVRAVDAELSDVLKKMFHNQPLDYSMENKTIVIGEKGFMSGQSKSFADQLADIRGKVVDSKGQTLPGVSVKIKGTTTGTTTDIDGNFTLNVSNDATLVFTYIGFNTQEILVSGRTSINITLLENEQALSEVVVTALGISRETKSLSYAAQSVSGEELNKAGGVLMGLQGKVAGLFMGRGGDGGTAGASNVQLRGTRSFNGYAAPLYVTDGVINSSGTGNVEDIESITILKGAAAAALYGSQGQNGAIIITTKQAKAGQTSVTYTGGLTLDKLDVQSEYQYEYGQGDEGIYNLTSERSFGPKMTGQNVTLWNGHVIPYTGQKDRFEEFFNTASELQNTLTIANGGEKTQTYFSYRNSQNRGLTDNNKGRNHYLNLRVSHKLSKKLSVDTRFVFAQGTSRNPLVNYGRTSIYMAPVSIPLSEMKDYEYIDALGDPRQDYWKPGSAIQGNPYYFQYRNLGSNQSQSLTGFITAKYEFNSWLSFLVRANTSQNSAISDTKIYNDTYGSSVGSNYSKNTSWNTNTNADALLSFKRNLSSKISLSGQIGGEVKGIGSSNTSLNANANGLNVPNFFFMSNAKAATSSNGYSQGRIVQSLYSSLTFGYNDYLYFDVTARNDWSSSLPPNRPSIFYPSFGLTAVVSDMINMPSWVSFGKARISHATAGGLGGYQDRPYYGVSAGGSITFPTTKYLEDYKPEFTTSFEAGLDWRFFKNRFGFDVSYYQTDTKNQVVSVGVPSATLYSRETINAGLVKNNGVEVMLNGTPVKTKRFSWDASFNYAKNNNKIAEITESMKEILLNDDGQTIKKAEEGKEWGTIYVKGWQRDAQGRQLVDNLGRPLLTSEKNVYAGSITPDFMAGLSNTFNFDNFSLGFLIDHRNGGVVISGRQPLLDAAGHSQRSLLGRENGIILDAYLKDGSKNTKTISSQAYFGAIGDRYPTGEEYTYSATNTRLRELTLSYKVPTKLLSKANIKSASVSLVGRNLFFFDKSTPFDPDIQDGDGGAEGATNTLPFTKTYGLTLQVGF